MPLALKHLATLANNYPIDLDCIFLTGHSAGGHLTLCLGAHSQLNNDSELHVGALPDIKGIVSLAGITDHNSYYAPSGCGSNRVKLVGGLPGEYPKRYSEESFISFLLLNIPQRFVNGENDDVVSIDHITPYFDLAKIRGEDVELMAVPDADHFDFITPGSLAWPAILGAFEELLGG